MPHLAEKEAEQEKNGYGLARRSLVEECICNSGTSSRFQIVKQGSPHQASHTHRKIIESHILTTNS